MGLVEYFGYKKVDAVKQYSFKKSPQKINIGGTVVCLKIEIDEVIIHDSPVSFVVIVYWVRVEALRWLISRKIFDCEF